MHGALGACSGETWSWHIELSKTEIDEGFKADVEVLFEEFGRD